MPSSFDAINSPLILFTLRNLKGDEESGLFGLSATQLALRRSMASRRSYFFIDEASVLLEEDRLAMYVGEMFATLRKAGGSIDICMQDPDILASCAASSKIRQNLSWQATGRVNSQSVDSFVKLLKYPKDLIEGNTLPGFRPSLKEMASNWLVDVDGQLTPATFYASPMALGQCLTNKHQRAAYEHYKAQWQGFSNLEIMALWGS